MGYSNEDMLLNSIERCHRDIQSYEDEISRCKRQIQELEQLHGRYREIQNKLTDMGQSSLRQLGTEGIANSNLQIVRAYTEGMRGLLAGARYEQAEEDLNDGILKIQRKIWELENEITSLYNRIDQCYQDISAHHRALEHMRAEKAGIE